MNKFAALAAFSLLATTGTAHANNFQGARVEAHLGFDAFQLKSSETEIDQYYDDYNDRIVTDTYGPYKDRTTNTGLLFGLGLGYDYAVSDKAIIGLEVNADFSNAKLGRVIDPSTENSYNVPYFEIDDESYITRVKAGRELDISLRAGYAVNPSTLLYVKGGYVNSRVKFNGFDEIDEGESYTYKAFDFGKNRGGFRLGGGIETLLGSNSFVKAEYRYTKLSKVKLNTADTYSVTDDDDNEVELTDQYIVNIGAERHQALVGIGFRF